MAGPLAGILDEVGLVKNDPGPFDSVKPVCVFAEDVVIDDDSARSLGLTIIDAQNLNGCIVIDHEYLALPVEFQGGGTHD